MRKTKPSSNPLKLSKQILDLGYTGSPLPLDEWLKLLEIIDSGQSKEGTSKRVKLPPVIICCQQCQKEFVRKAGDYHKAITKGQGKFCSYKCSAKVRKKLCQCGKEVGHRNRVRCLECTLARREQKKKETQKRNTIQCRVCRKDFLRRESSVTACSLACERQAHSVRIAGENNPKWKGGSAKERVKPRNAREFRVVRPIVIEEDGGCCVQCHGKDRLSVHHIDENALNNDTRNLVTLCGSCHISLHRTIKRNPTKWSWLSGYAKSRKSMISRSQQMLISSPTDA
jgi:hypothetical protein